MAKAEENINIHDCLTFISGSVCYICFAVAVVGQALTPSTFLTTVDRERLRSVFESAQPYTDAANAHYSILGLKLLGATIPKEQEVCRSVTSSVEANSVASWFHASSAAKALSGCKLSPGNAEKLLTAAVAEDSSVADIYYAYFALKNLGLAVDGKKVLAALTEALKKDDSPLSHSYAFRVATELNTDLNKYFDLIEDVVAQADEVDDKYLQFEGGLFVSASVVDSSYKLAGKVGKAPTISQDKVLKFANYFMSRKHVHQLKSAYALLSAVNTLTDNKFHVPVAVTLDSQVSVTSTKPSVQVRVTNLMGGSLGKLTVTADSAKNMGDQSVVVNKKQFKATKEESLYEMDFMANKPSSGFYKVTISVEAQKADSRLIGTSGASVTVKVTTQIAVESVEIGVADKDQGSAPKPSRIQYPEKVKTTLEADFHQKLIMKFTLKDKSSGKAFAAHQTFVKLTNLESKQEIIFVAEADSSNVNKFDLNVGGSAKDFGYKSGKYNVELIVGDAVIENPISWKLADVALTFQEMPATGKKVDQYAKKPEIKHMFREPEKRPSKTVSLAFTGLVLVPFAILFICWMKIGVNISNFPFSVSAIGFHVCLGALFGLYYMYWTTFNMFDTLRYLGLLGIPTFIFGNRLLSSIAARRKGEKS
ncbi:dolichyl-diphosphooligosaccharide--protein glycosyltransferase subunit 2-like [Ruditapes philippinarum]|uniref:dolichyl-diphosphooligosaccharide--protein glycosyltransferase subunit 2-like n=1 Tax=Ruditapes philippinarum TaxID=129788 RepID=UPI00295C2AD4|nr:dolichyl-diphosphooligosaccharide--protein glycosyltransferase subunit 2-like [Ruditapes philippinarum]